ncbi:hypothetical protein [Deinococcus malanensis]|nr:hypothetical protein [Deinococcus malanensis]
MKILRSVLLTLGALLLPVAVTSCASPGGAQEQSENEEGDDD